MFHCSEGWATCSPGFFLRGFHRGNGDELKSIKWATCCKPSLHPYSYPDCYDQDAGQKNLRQCRRDGFLLVGLYRGAGEQLSSIKKLRCCKMLESKWICLHFIQFLCAIAGNLREFRISRLLGIRKKLCQIRATTLTFHTMVCRVHVHAVEVGYLNRIVPNVEQS